ncbi:polysaccharide biosynthesis C-terminal domain-containing protein [candidate division WOR-3 bacterium]|nr:polysaccharide biosynthesis C-terminal domain-containing protein [candidate division WOR-3 bacterium]
MNLFKESLHTTTTQILCLLFGVGTSIILNRTLGPAGKGEFVSLIFIPQLVISCINLGLAVSGSYFIGKRKYAEGDVFRSNLFASLILGCLGIFAGWIIIKLYPGVPSLLKWLVLLTIIPGVWLLYIPDFFLSKDRIIAHNNWNLLWQIGRFTLLALFIFILPNKLFASISSIFSLHLIFFILSFLFITKLINTQGNINLSYLKDGINFGYKVFFVDLLAFLNYRFDILLLRLFSTAEEVGYYSTAIYMVEILWLIPRGVSLVLYSKFITSSISEKTARNAISITMLIVIITGIISIFLLKPVIRLLYTESFLPASIPYLILLPGVVALVLPKLLISEITGSWGRPELVLWGMIITVILNITLNLITIPKFGMIGAALSSTTAYIVETIFFISVYRKVTKKSLKNMFLLKIQDIRNLLTGETKIV